jgi:putative ABC transport system permease protein
MFRPLPWEFAIRNLLRRPLRSGLTFVGLTTILLLVLAVIGFIRGLERSLAKSGDARTAIIFGMGMGENLEYSSIPARTASLVESSVDGVQQRYGRKYASPELYQATMLVVGDREEPSMGLVRGVTPNVLLVRRQVELTEGSWPEPGEVLIGRLAAAKLSVGDDELDVGKTIELEGRTWRISGRFAAANSVFGSEIWCRLDDLQDAMQRQDLSLVAVTLRPDADFADFDAFCKGRPELELQTVREKSYYAGLQRDYKPVRMLAWLIALMVAAAGVFAGLNTMYGAVMGRVRELATLQTLGFSRRAVLVSLIQESVVLSVAAALAAAGIALFVFNGMAIRFTMGAFEMRVDSAALLAGFAVALVLGVIGAIPPAIRALRMPVVDGLKAV